MKIGRESIFLKFAKFVAMKGYATNFDLDYLSIIKKKVRITTERTLSLKPKAYTETHSLFGCYNAAKIKTKKNFSSRDDYFLIKNLVCMKKSVVELNNFVCIALCITICENWVNRICDIVICYLQMYGDGSYYFF